MSPIEKILLALEENSCTIKKSSKGWMAQCPAHDDRNPSLEVKGNGTGKASIKCYRGCEGESILSALNLSMKDLYPDTIPYVSTSTEFTKSRKKNKQTEGDYFGMGYATEQKAITALDAMMDKEQAKRVGLWPYHDKDGSPVCVITRYDSPTPEGGKQKKTFRPVSLKGDGWILGGMIEPKPLYGLPEILTADQVFITEGEKAADTARQLGLTATTSMNGSQSPGKTDWSPLAGKQCVILPDNDHAGEKYADIVIDQLSKLSPPAVVKLVSLSDLPEKGDIVDWVEARSDVDQNELKQQILELVTESEVIQTEKPSTKI